MLTSNLEAKRSISLDQSEAASSLGFVLLALVGVLREAFGRGVAKSMSVDGAGEVGAAGGDDVDSVVLDRDNNGVVLFDRVKEEGNVLFCVLLIGDRNLEDHFADGVFATRSNPT